MQSAEVLYFNPCAFKTLCIKYLFVCVCHTGGVSAACSWVRLCPVRPLLVQDEGRLVTLALTDLVAIAVKNAFSSRCFWSFVKLWLMLRTVCAPFLANCCYAVVDPVFFPWWFAVWSVCCWHRANRFYRVQIWSILNQMPLPGTFQRLCKGQWQTCQG